MVDKFLSLFLCKDSLLHITLEVDVKESGCTSERHSSTVLVLNSTEIAEVNSLNCFLSCSSRLGNIAAIDLSHFLEVFKSTNLVSDLLTGTDLFLSHRTCVKVLLSLLILDKEVNAVEGNTSVVTDNTASAVSVRKSCKDLV